MRPFPTLVPAQPNQPFPTPATSASDSPNFPFLLQPSPTNLFFDFCPSLLPSLLTDHSFLFELAFASVFVFMYLLLHFLFFFRLSLSLPSSLPA